MKPKSILRIAIVACMLTIGTNAAQAQFSLGDLWNSITGNKKVDSKSIVGTWTYSEPAIEFESDNVLTKAAAAYAQKKIDAKLSQQLSKYGFAAGKFTITFKEDGTFTETIRGKQIAGKYKAEDGKLAMTYGESAVYKGKTTELNTKIEGGKLMFLSDASKLLNVVKSIGNSTSNQQLTTVTALMKNVKGVKVGLVLTKK